MDILHQSELELRKAGYDTWAWSGGRVPLLCFEGVSVIGFVHAFETGSDLKEGWKEAQQRALSRFATALRAARDKAWNVYSVFLTSSPDGISSTAIEEIEEDFSFARKIVRCGVLLEEDIQHALQPLLPIRSRPLIEGADFAQRLRERAKLLPAEALTAFINGAEARDVVLMLEDSSR